MGAIGFVCLAGCLAVAPPPAGPERLPGRVDFERHVMGVLGRAGCSAAACHGSFQGKGGLRLSLFGSDPDKDHEALVRGRGGRRVDRESPDDSRLLLKPTGREEHGGGVRFAPDSWEYRVLRDWVARGAPRAPGSGRVEGLTADPAEVAFDRAGGTRAVRVTARFADGTSEDVTALCDFRTNDDAVADVSKAGAVTARRPGSTAVVVTYLGAVRAVPVLVPVESPPGFVYPAVPEANFVDRAVFARLRRLNVVPADLCTDAEFLRRVTIDTTGTLPTPDEVRAFLADPAADKRARKVDALLAHPLHAAVWATKFSDVTGNDTRSLDRGNPASGSRQTNARVSQAWHDWFRKRVHENVPYDEIVRGVLCATSREGQDPQAWLDRAAETEHQIFWGRDSDYPRRKTLDLFWQRNQPVTPEQWGERTAAAFLGVRLECAQCHKHPFDRWTQADYRAYANVFGAVAKGPSPAAAGLTPTNPRYAGFGPPTLDREIYLAAEPAVLAHPETGTPLPAKAPGGPEVRFEPGQDMREAVWRWLRRPDNPSFARSFVNRVWAHYLGRGIVNPVDDFSQANPPSNPALLDALADDFVRSGFDIRHVERLILTSRTYQLGSRANDSNRHDRADFARSYPRALPAEAVVDVLNAALGTRERWGHEVVKDGCQAVEVGASALTDDRALAVLRRFGRPPRTAACDCQRTTAPGLPQALFLMADPRLLAKLDDPGGRLKTLLRSDKSDDAVLDELFLASVSRPPTAAERELFRGCRRDAPDRETAFADALWALLNTREFILNH